MTTWILAWFGGMHAAILLAVGAAVLFAIGALLKPRRK